MTSRQISRLLYRGTAEAIPDLEARTRAIATADRQVNRRTLRPLKDSGYITVVRPFLLGDSAPLAQKEVNVLTAKGAEIVKQAYAAQERGQSLRWSRSWLEIGNTNQVHASLLSDLYILARRAMGDGWRLVGWRDDRDLAQLTQQGLTALQHTIPDAVFVLSLRKDTGKVWHLPFLIQLDLGTETIFSARNPTRDWTAKIERYRTYFAGPVRVDPLWSGIAEPPRVLCLTTSDRRLRNLVEATRTAGGDDRYWFATIDHLRDDRDPISAFWHSAWLTAGSGTSHTLAHLSGNLVPS